MDTRKRHLKVTSGIEARPPEILRPPVLNEPFPTPLERNQVAILAQASSNLKSCRFTLNQPLLERYSWHFHDRESASTSALIADLFEQVDLGGITVHDRTLTLDNPDEPRERSLAEWETIALEVGQLTRKHLANNHPALDPELFRDMPSEEEVRATLQNVIDEEVNPGVAAHDGHIRLLRVDGNSIYIHMGGGCQGCSAADLTLKQGIHQVFRQALPQVGAIYDETDHNSGENPYFSEPL